MAICEIDKCAGCFACVNICPKHCIAMPLGECGHIFPHVDMDACIHCQLCKKICPVNAPVEKHIPKICYAAWSKDETERATSTSGGAASVFSKQMIASGGVVFGAAIDNKFHVKHIMVAGYEQLNLLKGSKYVQSHVNYAYKETKEQLNRGIRVLFTGTPCQIAGLLNFLEKPYKNLITCDLICNGVPSQQLLFEDTCYLINRKNLDGINFSFRSKEGHGMIYKLFEKGLVICKKQFYDTYYYLGFERSLFCRKSCYQCVYANEQRISDITIGDFWGLGDDITFNSKERQKGISVILCNTEQGIQYFAECNKSFTFAERPLVEAVNGNARLKYPCQSHKNSELFSKLYDIYGFQKAAKKCLLRDKIKYITLYNAIKVPLIFWMIKKLKGK